jgi:alpha-glucosidase (family GH31 glycosyl hydrolase)
MAAFCPIMQFHSEFNHHREPCNDRTPWNIERQTGDTRVISIFRKFANIRTLLIPYLENEALEAIKSGRPLMAGLFFDFAQDQEIWKAPYQYLLGRYLLVAPVVEPGVTTWKVYLPEGIWIDFWSKSKFNGKNWIDFEVPIDCIPIFIKIGAPKWILNQLWGDSI